MRCTADEQPSLLVSCYAFLHLLQKLQIPPCQFRLCEHVGAFAEGAFERLFAPPFVDFAVVAGEQDFGDLPAAKFGRLLPAPDRPVNQKV